MINFQTTWFIDEYREVCEDLEVPSKFFMEDLLHRYEEPHRFYHNVTHIQRMNYVMDEGLAAKAMLTPYEVALVKFATFYHDAVYVPGWALNEEMSAAYCQNHMIEMNIPHTTRAVIRNLIIDTQRHEPVDHNRMAAVICTADLYELGTNLYDINGRKIWKEAGEPEPDIWGKGRRGFLEAYLAKKLFHLPGMEDHEARAKKNMRRELATLGGCPRDTDGDGNCGQRYCPFCSER